MDKGKLKTVNLEASNVEACRICLATDIKLNVLYDLQDTRLGTCMEAVTGYTKSCVGLPNYICYECVPWLIKCSKFIEKSKTAQATLLDIFNKNGQVNETLIKSMDRSELKLKSTFDSYLLQNYYYIKYDDDNNTSDYIPTDIDPNEKINIELKNEIKEEAEVISDEIIQIIQDSIESVGTASDENKIITEVKNESDAEVEAIEAHVPIVEIISDDEKIGDDFVSLQTYEVKMDNHAQDLMAHSSTIPRYRVTKGKGLGKVKENKKKKKKKPYCFDDAAVNRDELHLKKHFHIDIAPSSTTQQRRYTCHFCPETFDYVNDAKDHTVIGCTKPQRKDRSSLTTPTPESNSTMTSQPRTWKMWPGDSK